MNTRRLASLAVALAVAGVTAWVVNGQLAGPRAAAPVHEPVAEAPALPEVLVAGRALPAGSFIKTSDLAWRPWPKETAGEPYLVRGKVAEKDLVGAVVRTHLYGGEPITAARVAHPGEQGFLAAVLEPGQRAVAVPVDATSGVAGFIFPGDNVDVLFTLKRTVAGDGEDEAELRQFSQTLLTDVRVLAIDQTLDSDGGGARIGKTATLQVSASQAERLALALDMGTLSLSLRSLARVEAHAGDGGKGRSARGSDAVATGNVGRSYTRDTDVLFMIGDPLGLPPPLALRRKVEVLRGSEAKQVRF